MIYRLHYGKLTNEFIEIENTAFQNIQLACIASEFQKISRDAIEVYTSDETGGMIFPDFYYDDAVPLFSEQCIDMMQKSGADNLFIKEVIITDAIQEISRKYILGLPPRIDVINSKGIIDETKAANYLIFKTANPLDNNIYITEKLKKVFQKNKPLGMEIIETDVL